MEPGLQPRMGCLWTPPDVDALREGRDRPGNDGPGVVRDRAHKAVSRGGHCIRRAIGSAVRRFCLDCQGASPAAVRACADAGCALWPCRLPGVCAAGDAAEAGRAGSRGLLRAVRRYCLDCAGGRHEVRACQARQACPLWSYRFGVRPQTWRAVHRRFFAPRELTLPVAPALSPASPPNVPAGQSVLRPDESSEARR